MKKIFNTVLFVIFVITFAVFIYSNSRTPTIVKTSASSTAIEKDIEKAKNNDISKEEIGKIVKDYLLENPDILYNILEDIQKKKAEEQTQKTSDFLKENVSEINSAGEPPFLGSRDADIIVVVFYDYNCSFCKQAHTHIKKVLETEKNVKFVLRPMPILNESSVYVAKAALSLHKIAPNRFYEMHDKLMAMKKISEDSVKQMVESYGVDFEAVENEMNSFSIKSAISKNYDLAKNIGIKGAPSQVINGTFVPGLLEADKYHYIFKTLRSMPNDTKNSEGENKEENKEGENKEDK